MEFNHDKCEVLIIYIDLDKKKPVIFPYTLPVHTSVVLRVHHPQNHRKRKISLGHYQAAQFFLLRAVRNSQFSSPAKFTAAITTLSYIFGTATLKFADAWVR